MTDRYLGMVKCPYCGKETEYYHADEWGENQICSCCGKSFKTRIVIIARKLTKKEMKEKKL